MWEPATAVTVVPAVSENTVTTAARAGLRAMNNAVPARYVSFATGAAVPFRFTHGHSRSANFWASPLAATGPGNYQSCSLCTWCAQGLLPRVVRCVHGGCRERPLRVPRQCEGGSEHRCHRRQGDSSGAPDRPERGGEVPAGGAWTTDPRGHLDGSRGRLRRGCPRTAASRRPTTGGARAVRSDR